MDALENVSPSINVLSPQQKDTGERSISGAAGKEHPSESLTEELLRIEDLMVQLQSGSLAVGIQLDDLDHSYYRRCHELDTICQRRMEVAKCRAGYAREAVLREYELAQRQSQLNFVEEDRIMLWEEIQRPSRPRPTSKRIPPPSTIFAEDDLNADLAALR